MAVYQQIEEWVGGVLYENTYLLENTLYGSSRLGTADYGKSRLVASVALADVYPPLEPLPTYELVYQSDRGNKRYELSNHLGNVLVVVSDFLDGEDTDGDNQANYYAADVVSASDYYPYGWVMPDRSVTAEYRYGFNGQETDKEWRGGQAVSFRFRVSDSRIGRFLSVDPLSPEYPWYTPYQFAGNKVIQARELEGLEEWVAIYHGSTFKGFEFHENLLPLEGGIYIDRTDPVTLSGQRSTFYPAKEYNKSINYAIAGGNGINKTPEEAKEVKKKPGNTNPLKANKIYFQKLENRSRGQFKFFEVDGFKDFANIAEYLLTNNFTVGDGIWDYHGTSGNNYDGLLWIGDDYFEGDPQTLTNEYKQYASLLSKFNKDEESSVLLGHCNAHFCKESLMVLSGEMNNTIFYAHHNYSWSLPILMGKGKYYSEFAQKQGEKRGDVAGGIRLDAVGLYFKIIEDYVKEVRNVRFNQSNGSVYESNE